MGEYIIHILTFTSKRVLHADWLVTNWYHSSGSSGFIYLSHRGWKQRVSSWRTCRCHVNSDTVIITSLVEVWPSNISLPEATVSIVKKLINRGEKNGIVQYVFSIILIACLIYTTLALVQCQWWVIHLLFKIWVLSWNCQEPEAGAQAREQYYSPF